MSRIPVYVYQHNHFDPLWQRCWDRTFDYCGKRYRSYAEVQDHAIGIWLESAKRGLTFTEGQSVVLRKYLERNPDRLAEVCRLVQDGQIELMASGEIVCDTNMPSGETLLRNLVLGQRYFEDTFGVIPGIGSLEDAFGHSAQMPQLYRGVECKIVINLSRKKVPGDYWRGLDGSVVFKRPLPSTRWVGHWRKISPCAVCSGMGCKECGGRGLSSDAAGIADEDVWRKMTTDWGSAPFGILVVGGEEAVPNARLPDMVERAQRELDMDLRMGILDMMSSHFADATARVDEADLEVSDQVESNCVYTGCYVSRISTKQNLRRIENLVNTAERWATVAYLLGAEYPSDDLLAAWRHTVFLAFHDVVTGTMLDQPYHETLEMLAEAEVRAECVIGRSLACIEQRLIAPGDAQYLAIFNSDSWERDDPVTTTAEMCGTPRIVGPSGDEIEVLDACATGSDITLTFRAPAPALGFALFEIIPDSRPVDSGAVSTEPGEVENALFTVRVSDKGIESILDKRSGQELAHPDYLISELLLEEDKGDPWGTMEVPPPAECLSAYTTGVRIRRATNVSEVSITGHYKGDDPGVRILSWRQSMFLYKDYDRIDFRTEVDWDTERRRIRLAFPTGLKKDEAVYSIPYGALRRSSYEPEMDTRYGTNGDWPAVNWIDVYDEERDCGVALINAGTPSHKVENGVIFLSVLRSPADIWSVTEEDYDYCLDFDDARDAGVHEFRYSLVPHTGSYRSAGIERRGREFNNPLICRRLNGAGGGKLSRTCSFLELDATDNVLICAIKRADRDDSIIVRLAETGGAPGEASVRIEGAGNHSYLVNFLERHPRPISGPFNLTPFKIVTVRLAR